jgi:hypothetical protein
MAENRIPNPFIRGQEVVIPAGTPVRHRGDVRLSRRTQTITVFSTSNGWLDLWGDRHDRGAAILPTITWPGSGGYWSDVQVTPELVEANGLTAMPEAAYDTAYEGRLDASPLLADAPRWGVTLAKTSVPA